MLALGWSPGFTGVQAAILLPTDWLVRAPRPAVLSQCPLLEAYCGIWSDACQKGLSAYHEWTPQPLKYSDSKKKPFPFKAPQVLSPQHVSLMNSKQFLSLQISPPLYVHGWSQSNFSSGGSAQTWDIEKSNALLCGGLGLGLEKEMQISVNFFHKNTTFCFLLCQSLQGNAPAAPWLRLYPSLEVCSCWRQKLGRDECCRNVDVHTLFEELYKTP